MIKKSTDLARKMAEKKAQFYATFFLLPPVTFLFDFYSLHLAAAAGQLFSILSALLRGGYT